MRTTLSYVSACALIALAAPACSVTTTTDGGPTILDVTPDVTDNADGTFNVDLRIDFDDSLSGDLVEAYTFQTDDGQVDDVDVELPTPVASPFTIAGLTLPMDENGEASLGFHIALYGADTGLGSTFNGTINVN
jgi:hypothetical protein